MCFRPLAYAVLFIAGVICIWQMWLAKSDPSSRQSSFSLFGTPRDNPNPPEDRMRIAILTFTTQEKSYTHLSLKTKDRTSGSSDNTTSQAKII